MGDRIRNPAGTSSSAAAIRDIAQRWPIVLLIVVLAVVAAVVAGLSRDASYSARVGMLVTPLAQYDETFLGTSFIRDAGDAARTAATVAETLETRAADEETAERMGDGWTAERVADHITVRAVDGANVVEVTGTASDRATAARLATTFAESVLDVRWKTISQELLDRVKALDQLRNATSGKGVLLRDREIIVTARVAGADPTLRVQDREPEVTEDGPGTPLIVALAVIGGLLVGCVAALLAARAGRRPGDAAPPVP